MIEGIERCMSVVVQIFYTMALAMCKDAWQLSCGWF